MSEFIVEVFPRGKDFDGMDIASDIKEIGIKGVSRVSTSRLYVMSIPGSGIDDAAKERIASEILTDPVSEEFSITRRKADGVDITVSFKPGVLDLEGRRVVEALDITGNPGISEARAMRRYIIKFEQPPDAGVCDYLSSSLLYNKVIQKADITIETD